MTISVKIHEQKSQNTVTGGVVPSLTDLFPASQRVVYDRAPLTQVVCQVRFPQILRIESQPPADFQERIRHIFPLVEKAQVQLPPELPPELAQMIGAGAALSSSYSFQTEDQVWTLNLASSAISITTKHYERWERFCEHMVPALEALIGVYAPSFFQRIGLRYVNIIDREKFGLADVSWSRLLKPSILGELADPSVEAITVDMARNIRLVSSDDQCALFLQHGLAKKKSNPNIAAYRLDFDFYRDAKTEVNDARATIDGLNSMVGRAFRWCITDVLHDALGPHPI